MKSRYKIVLVIIVVFAVLFFYYRDKKVYVFKEYSPSGILLGTNEYVIRNDSTIMHGKFVNYNQEGVEIAKGNFVNNEPHGICSYYYSNGKIESVSYRKNSKIDLESTYYNQNGSIRKYTMCNDLGEPKFIIEFDEKIVKSFDGYATYPVNQYKILKGKKSEIYTRDTLKIGDVIKYDFLVANIPYTIRNFKIETEGVDNSKIKRTITTEAPTRIIVEEVLTKKGLNRIKAITQYTFDDKVTPVKNDTVSFDVNVN